MTYQIYIYTLALKDGFYYVGKTIDPDRRFNEHFSEQGAVWTKLHPPIEVMGKESFLVSSPEEEDRWENHQTIKMMKLKNWQMVRGGFWCQIGEIETLKNLHHFGFFLDVDIESVTFSKRTQYIFLLQLENNKYFVGYSYSLQLAFKNHEKGIASNWTRIYKPIKLLEYKEVVFDNGITNLDLANEWVLQYGAKYGYENIRGGSFTIFDTERNLELMRSFLNKQGKSNTIFKSIIYSKLIERYENENTIIDYDLPLKESEQVMVIYVLELKGGYFHISYSSDLTTLMLKYERGKCCEWCKLHTPIKLLEVIPVICPKDNLVIIDQLDLVVDRFFKKYGPERVRGGRFLFVDEKLHLQKVFERYKTIGAEYVRFTFKELAHLKYERRKLRKPSLSDE